MLKRGHLGWLMFAVAACALAWIALPGLALSLSEYRLNRLYAEFRPFVYRWSGAPHAPLSARAVPSARVASIRDLIAWAEHRGSRNARSIRLTGRLEALSGRLDRALAALRLAHWIEPEDASILSELGAMYARRAVTENRAADFAPALDAVLKAATMAPDSAVAAFNAAAVFDEFPLPRQAVPQWAEAMRRDPDSAWKDEAARRQQKWSGLPARGHDFQRAQDAGATELAAIQAVESWLPQRNGHRDQLNVLAAALQQQHKDPWLADLLRLPESSEVQAAFQELSDAARANAAGEHKHAADSAAKAERRFHALGNAAGEMRARLEHVSALHRNGQSVPCLKMLDGMLEDTARRGYRWLHGQAWLDLVTCQGQQRNVDVLEERERAYQWIRGTGYTGLELRAIAFLIEQQVGLGNPLRVWTRGREGVLTYWKGVLPPIRLHPLYYSLAQSASTWEYPFAAVALARESVLTLQETGNRQLLAYVLSRLGFYEAASGMRREAAATYGKAADLFAAAKDDEVRLLRVLAEIQVAAGETQEGQAQAALARLRRLPSFEFGAYAQLFVRPAVGSALLAANRLPDAVAEFQQAIAENEQHRQTLKGVAQLEASNREVAAAYTGLTEARLRSGDTSGALDVLQRYRTGAYRRPLTAPSLPANSAMLVTAFLGGGVSVWYRDREGIVQHWVDAEMVRAAGSRLAEVASDPSVPAELVASAAKRLSAYLLGPIDHRLAAANTLLIDTDGPLGRIPWPLLTLQNGDRLVDRMALVQIHGRLAAAAASPVRLTHALILADPDLGPEDQEAYPRLTDARREAEWLHTRLPDSLLLTGGDVNLEAVTRRTRERHVVHFAGHGVSYGGFGALVVAGLDRNALRASLVTGDQLAGVDLSAADLVFLAACSTGSGESFGAVNTDTLIHSLLQAGAARVVAARWNVASGPTSRMVTSFYDLLLNGTPPAEALRQTMLSVSRQPGFSHPYYWAGFQVFGAP